MVILDGKATSDKIKQEIASLKGDDADSTMEDIQAQIDALRKEVEQKNKK